jgi:hypothetical protein
MSTVMLVDLLTAQLTSQSGTVLFRLILDFVVRALLHHDCEMVSWRVCYFYILSVQAGTDRIGMFKNVFPAFF